MGVPPRTLLTICDPGRARPSTGSAVNGNSSYYIATATVLPLLIVAYLFSIDAQGAVQKMIERRPVSPAAVGLIGLGVIGIGVAIVSAVGGEYASLSALYYDKPNGTNAFWSWASILGITLAAVINMIVAFGNQVAKSSAETAAPAATEPVARSTTQPVAGSAAEAAAKAKAAAESAAEAACRAATVAAAAVEAATAAKASAAQAVTDANAAADSAKLEANAVVEATKAAEVAERAVGTTPVSDDAPPAP